MGHATVQRIAPSRWATTLTFILADSVAFLLVSGLILLTAASLASHGLLYICTSLLPVFGMLSLAHAFSGLYNAAAMHPAQELRRAVIVTILVYAAYTLSVYLVAPDSQRLLLLLLAAAALSVVVVPVTRALSRVVCAQLSWWGIPVVVLASEEAGRAVVNTLNRWPELGFKPVALLQPQASEDPIHGVPLVGQTSWAPFVASRFKVPYAIVAMPELSHRELVELLGRYSKHYQRIFVIPGLAGRLALWTSTRSFEGLMGYDIQHGDWKWHARFIKRLVDVLGAGLGLLLLTPALAVVALLVKLDSPGPVFFKQKRMGKNGRRFELFKFRTMYADAEEKLEEILLSDSVLRAEYEVFHKLRDDPRITRIGRLLRQYSLDELPQLWNVFLGHMSLVGPRAYIPEEQSKMEGLEHTILQCAPGITGLWQVSGRNALSFEERMNIDVHYMHNWTPWLDFYILARTVPVVLTGEGAC